MKALSIGTDAKYLIGGFMLVSAFISMDNEYLDTNVTSNWLVWLLVLSEKQQSYKDFLNFQTALLLGIAYVATIGGISTPIGTAPTIVVISLIQTD